MKSIKSMKRSIILAGILILVGPCLYFLSRYNYNLFHLAIEFSTMIVGTLIFTLAIVSQRYKTNVIILRLGAGLLAVVFVTFLHAISYKGMNVFIGYDSNLPTQLWIILSYIQSISVLSIILFLNIKIKSRLFLVFYMFLAIALTYLCFARIFPVCYIEGEGLTAFKKISEYIIIAIYLISLALLFTKRKNEIRNLYKGFPFAIVAFIISEFMFTLYTDVYGIQNFLGHYIRFIGMVIIYVNIGIVNLQNPYKKIIINLEKKEQAILNSEKMFRLMFEDAPLGYQSLNRDGYFIAVNQTWLDMLGYTKEEVVGKWFGDFIAPEEAERFKINYQKFKYEGTTSVIFEMLKKNKERITVRFDGRIAYDEKEEFKQSHCILQDVTEQLRIEKALMSSETRYRAIFDQAQLGIASISLDGKFVNANPKCCALLGYDLEELKQLTISDLTHPDDVESGRTEYAKLFNRDKDIMVMENRYIRKDGTIIYLYSLTSLIIDKNNTPEYTMTTIEDITERKRLEEEKIKMEAHLNQQQRLESIGTLAGGVAHEINNPINGIMNYGQLILESSDADNENSEYAKEIINESKRIAAIVENLLRFSRNEKQGHSFANINDIIEQTLSLIKTVIKHDQIDLRIDIPEGLPKLKCRSQQIQQVIMNLLTNARDALNDKYPEYNEDKLVKLYCKQFKKDNRRWLRITIEDHGNGIPEAMQENIFEPFFTSKSRDKGTGLGLSISYGIVKEHHGELTFETKEGEYTRFYLDLPVDNGWNL
jgi:PAS domain S-box-containing protein